MTARAVPTAETAPLAEIRVLDFSQIMQGPAATQVLGDFGADVIKVERPKGGDIFRWSIDDPAGPDHPAFVSLNRNKRSLAVDLGTPEGKEIVGRIARTADVVVSNFRPGVMERLGLGYEQLAAVNPGIIWAVGLGYGSKGPYVAKGGQDMLAQAYSGAMSHLLEGWEPRVYPVSLADYSTGMHLVQGILLALLAREKTGRGQMIECSLYDSMLAMQMLEAGMVLNGRRPLNWAVADDDDVVLAHPGAWAARRRLAPLVRGVDPGALGLRMGGGERHQGRGAGLAG